LSARVGSDFKRLFRKYDGVQAGCWCMFYHRDGPIHAKSETARGEQNRLDHRNLVRAGRGQGFVVYRDGEPVGWCQYCRRDELPRVEPGRKYRALAPSLANRPRWRITCFFVDRPARRQGVARTALHSALERIARTGGGIVEAYPATSAGPAGSGSAPCGCSGTRDSASCGRSGGATC
ncbi:MAG: GNAT family N-acetyltransferase, partial [Thermoplasmata archaeon]